MSRMDDLREPVRARSTGVASALVPARILYPREPRRLRRPQLSVQFNWHITLAISRYTCSRYCYSPPAREPLR